MNKPIETGGLIKAKDAISYYYKLREMENKMTESEMLDQVKRLHKEMGRLSVHYLQRKMMISYEKAKELIEKFKEEQHS